MITILLIDDHQLVRAGLRALLESVDDLRVVGEAGDGDAAVSLAVAERPDVVLMDLSMPRVDGVEATRRLAAAGVSTRVVELLSKRRFSVKPAHAEKGSSAARSAARAASSLFILLSGNQARRLPADELGAGRQHAKSTEASPPILLTPIAWSK